MKATRESFIQTIVDLSVPRMAFGRVALVGDAAFVPQPHTAASTSKAAGNALALADALTTAQDVPEVLTLWEPEQLRIGQYLRRLGQELGNRSQKAYSADTPT